MFEITSHDIAQLDDRKLRELVGLLCEAELRRCKISTSSVTWGGDQSAADGGLDVRVSFSHGACVDSFIPRPNTGFQVKKQDMPPRAIIAEMCPNGDLRHVIRELAESAGAYIIVSSQGSVADAALTNRKRAMADAVNGLAGQIVLDFYDRTRVATWVRNHAGLVVWVRREIGRAVPGWEPFGAWAYPAGGTEAEYLIENGVRVIERLGKTRDDLAAAEGLKKIRKLLRNAGSVVRIVGLSGVGKTRFVQALFDKRISEGSLDPAVAVYTNMNNEPNPQPFNLASDLIANNARAILIVDNCPSDLHARLAGLVTATKSSLSVLTVEYDIRDDQPESTQVFEIQVASVELIERLLQRRFPNLSNVDARTAADFSGGNARVALALAETAGRGGALGSLNNTELFERLFVQRKGEDRSLLEMAQAFALVYSFDGEDLSDGSEAELTRIARLVDRTADQAHRDMAELLRRDLAQRRGKWRAILPHALANRLAATALQDIPFARIQECLVIGAPERLVTSFSRRLGYLDDSREAAALVEDWLQPEGWVGKHIWNLSEFGKTIFRNSLPAAPEAGLRSLEINLPAQGSHIPITTGEYVPRALRSLAWDASLFERCTKLLETLAIYGEGRIAKDAIEIYETLFYLYLSGTHATVEQRIAVVQGLLNSESSHERSLGLSALNAMLRSSHFSSGHDFQFGAHSRDYGYRPKTNGDLAHWYRTAFAVAKDCALSEKPGADAAKVAISSNFRGLWTHVGLCDELESLAKDVAAKGFWREGWKAVKKTRFFDEKDKKSENYGRLSELEKLLRPRDLVQRVRGNVFSAEIYDDENADLDDTASFQTAMEQRQREAKSLGREVSKDSAALRELMPEIVGGAGNLWYFGMGLAQGTSDPMRLWQQIVEQFGATPREKRWIRALGGFLVELNTTNAPLVDWILDGALEHEPLAGYFPTLQESAIITTRGLERLIRSLELGKAPIETYSNFYFNNAVEVISAKDIARYFMAVANAPGGEAVAVQLIAMQFFSDRQQKRVHSAEIIGVGRAILERLNFDRHDDREEYQLNHVIEVCLVGEGGYDVANIICKNLKQAVVDHRTYGFNHDWLLKGLFKTQPRAVLDVLLSGEEEEVEVGANIILRSEDVRSGAIFTIGEAELFEWCGEDPINRFRSAALVVPMFIGSTDPGPAHWSPVALRLVHSAPDPAAVLRSLIARLRPMSWSGSRSTLLEKNAALLDEFDIRGNEALAALIAAQKLELQREAHADHIWETKFDKERDERFE